MDEDEAWRDADACSRGGRWDLAGPKWQALFERARDRGALARAREAAGRAADAFRRDDRPVAAAKMLRAAWEPATASVADAAQLSAVLVDLGQPDAALDIAREGLGRAREPASEALGLDALVGTALAAGAVDEAREGVARLARLALPGADLSVAFRRAQLARLDGALDQAQAGLTALVETLAAFPPAAAAEAGTSEELAEIAVLRFHLGHGEDWLDVADEHLVAAASAWQRARRRAGRMRVEAWQARVGALRGETVLHAPITRAVAYAEERGLALFEADLRACRAVVTRNPEDLVRALRLAAHAPLARGRLRVLLAELGHPADLTAARAELVADRPWTERLARAAPAP